MKRYHLMMVLPVLALVSCKQQVEVKSSSMEPTFKASTVVAWKTVPGSYTLKRGEVVLIRAPDGEGKWLRRVVGLPGEKIELTSSGVKVGSTEIDWKTLTGGRITSYDGAPGTYVVTPDGYFLLGDNFAHSRDGREFGSTKRSDIVGVVGK